MLWPCIQCATHHLPVFSVVVGASLIIVFALLFAPFVLRRRIVDAAGHSLPPGPLFRYAFLRKYPERALHAWAKIYGPLYSVWMGDQLFVVISHPKIAQDLLVNNGAIFSSRKNYFIKNQIILHDRAITASPYNNIWRQHRRIAMQSLSEKAVVRYGNVIDYEARILMHSLLLEGKKGALPVNPGHYAARFTLNNMLMISFGMRTYSTSDPLVECIQSLVTEFDDITGPWSNAVDFIKPLQFLPTTIRSRAERLHKDIIHVYGGMIQQMRIRLEAGLEVPDCLVKTLIETQAEEGLSDEDMTMIAVVFAFGGVHSISAIIQWFLAFMATNPHVASRAHEELDRVVGRSRWPVAEDESQLPYVRAIIKEVQRLHAPFWVPTPHYSTADFVYNGMFIPKDTVVVLNCWTMHHDEGRYPDPTSFNPDRYLGDQLSCAESSRLKNGVERDHWAFGAGRRICPGLAVAERELWLALSRLLWSYTFNQVPGEAISLQEYEGSSGRTPLPFRLTLRPRHENVQSVIEEEMDEKLR